MVTMEHEKSDRLTLTRLNNVSKPYKQDYKSKLMTKKYSLLPINPQQLTPVQRLSEKHPDFEIQPVNTIRPQKLNIQEPSSYWCPMIHQYRSLENTFLNNLTLIKL